MNESSTNIYREFSVIDFRSCYEEEKLKNELLLRIITEKELEILSLKNQISKLKQEPAEYSSTILNIKFNTDLLNGSNGNENLNEIALVESTLKWEKLALEEKNRKQQQRNARSTRKINSLLQSNDTSYSFLPNRINEVNLNATTKREHPCGPRGC